MLLVDLGAEAHRSRRGDQAQARFARSRTASGSRQNQITLDQLPEPSRVHGTDHETLLQRQRAFGYTDEDIRDADDAHGRRTAKKPIGSMGTDTPLACLSDKPQPLFNYFKQLFAQVTNPPIDPIREEMVMSLTSYIGTERNILDETPQHCHTLKLPHPILTNRDLEKLRRVSQGDFLATTLPTLFRGRRWRDRAGARARQPVPARVAGDQVGLHAADSLGPRRRRGLRADSEPARADGGAQSPGPRRNAHAGRADHRIGRAARGMHFCLLIGYGASAVNPYLAIETLEDLGAARICCRKASRSRRR